MLELLQLFVSFFAVGGLTFGGGYAMLPMLRREIVQKRAWVSEAEVLDYYAIGQCLPGLIAVNTAMFIGHRRKGVAGGIAAALGVITPSVLIILAVAMLLENMMGIATVRHAFAGIRIAVCALIIGTVIRLFRQNVRTWPHFFLFAGVLICVAFLNVSPIWVVLVTAPLGVLVGRLRTK